MWFVLFNDSALFKFLIVVNVKILGGVIIVCYKLVL